MSRRYDLLLTGATMIHPDRGLITDQAVGVQAGLLAYVGPADIDAAGVQTVDLAGYFLLPGLVDLHTHVYRGGSFWGIDHRRVTWRSGVTTWIDAGSSGAYNARGFRELLSADRSAGNVFGWLNISAIGLVGETFESQHLENCDVAAAAEVLGENRDFYVGLKVRIDHNTVGSNGVEPLRRAVKVAEQFGVPIMVHIGVGPPGLEPVLDLMRPGDLLTHCYTGTDMAPVDANGRVRPAAREAIERGVLLDLGHGAGGFSFRTAQIMLEAGLAPTTISSDLHQLSAHGPMVDLLTCMNKMLALGVPLPNVVAAATSTPARVAGLSKGAGTLEVSAPADLAIVAVDEGVFELFDVTLESRTTERRFRPVATIVGGRILPPVLPEPPVPWVKVSGAERAAYSSLRESVMAHQLFDAGDRSRFAVPDLLDWDRHA